MSDDDLHTDPLFPTDISDDERAAGFGEGSIVTTMPVQNNPWGPSPPARTAAVVRSLGNGLRAVKVVQPDGKIRYAIYNDKDRPAEMPASSIKELLARHPIMN